ncbi:hypothetical protein E5288_WYG021850 [Bos mutus]|uniref:Uncharacterized protein n=1 Tax=Bos mutus TaxID=72004 RepID=A0A6B0S8Z0_9CETA|nr:hypothetical protein [Bos mutus]
MKQAKKIAAMKAEKSPKRARQGLETSLRLKEPGKSRVTPSPEQQILVGPITPNFQEEQDKLKLTKPVKTTFIPEVPITLGVTKAHRILRDPRNPGVYNKLGPPRVSSAHEALSSPTCPLTGYPLNRVTLDLVFEPLKANYMICCLD